VSHLYKLIYICRSLFSKSTLDTGYCQYVACVHFAHRMLLDKHTVLPKVSVDMGARSRYVDYIDVSFRIVIAFETLGFRVTQFTGSKNSFPLLIV
jgi:hypothetical protein